MDKKQRKLINDVSHMLKTLSTIDDRTSVKVNYNFNRYNANIFWTTKTISTGNGYERWYDWPTIDKIKETSDSYGIAYRIGLTDALELTIQISVE